MATFTKRGDRLLGISAAARVAGVSRMTVHRAAARGELEFSDSSFGRLFSKSTVVAWAESRKEGKR